MSDQAFSSIDQVAQCMMDVERSTAFRDALREVVKPGMRVLDVGAGTGLLALFAAQAGADEVVTLEYDPYVASVARELIRTNGFQKKVKVVTCDATSAPLSNLGHFDALVMELLTTGMIDELQIPAYNHLLKCSVVNHETLAIPYRVITNARLVNADFSLLGLNMRVIRHLWFDFPGSDNTNNLSDEAIIDDVVFNSYIDPLRTTETPLTITEDGVANAIYLRSTTHLSSSVSLEDTMTLNAPVIIPLPTDIDVKAGMELKLQISFRAGAGFASFKVGLAAHGTDLIQSAA
jgi:predicted RNA methylase